VVYKGFTWNVTVGEAALLRSLLDRVERGSPMFKVDRHMAMVFRQSLDNYLEVAPGGATSSHAPADA